MLLKQLLAEGKTGPYYHAVSRTPLVEAAATHRAIHLAALAQAPLFVVHVTCKEAMEAVRDSYSKGLPIFGETCSHYLVLDTENLAMPDFEGAKYVCSPPLRSQEHRNALWEKDQEHLGKDDFTVIPNGAPGVENRLSVL
jgi:dihydropyrimidinase